MSRATKADRRQISSIEELTADNFLRVCVRQRIFIVEWDDDTYYFTSDYN